MSCSGASDAMAGMRHEAWASTQLDGLRHLEFDAFLAETNLRPLWHPSWTPVARMSPVLHHWWFPQHIACGTGRLGCFPEAILISDCRRLLDPLHHLLMPQYVAVLTPASAHRLPSLLAPHSFASLQDIQAARKDLSKQGFKFS